MMVEKEQFRLERILSEKREELSNNQEVEKEVNLNELIERYYVLKNIAYEKYYPQIQKLYPWYTDHGEKHVESIMLTLGEMLNQSHGRLNEMEVFILLVACIFHDTGMVVSRGGHADNVIEIIKEMKDIISDISVLRQINEVARAHSSKNDLMSVKCIDSCTFKGIKYAIQTRALAAMLRLADDISETRYRIDTNLLDKVPVENAIFWHYANAIESVEISMIEMNCKIKVSIPKSILLKEFLYEGESKVFFEYVLDRIEKSYNERVVCSLEFRNIMIISSIQIQIIIMSEDLFGCLDEKEFEINENYFPTMSFKDAFYQKNPDWCLDSLRLKEYMNN